MRRYFFATVFRVDYPARSDAASGTRPYGEQHADRDQPGADRFLPPAPSLKQALDPPPATRGRAPRLPAAVQFVERLAAIVDDDIGCGERPCPIVAPQRRPVGRRQRLVLVFEPAAASSTTCGIVTGFLTLPRVWPLS
jgi:hypothetical protein